MDVMETYRMGLDHPRRRGSVGGGGSNDRCLLDCRRRRLLLLLLAAGNHGRVMTKARRTIIVQRGRSSFVEKKGFGFGHVTSIAFERRGTRILIVTTIRQPKSGATGCHDGSCCRRCRP
jgi:hypothetical protein